MVLLLFLLRKKRKLRRIRQWQKMLNLQEHQQIFQQLYQPIDGFMLSNQARQKQNAIEYTYGEIKFLPFIALLSLVKPDHKTIFYDLGSGIGKAVLACAMVYPVRKSVGVELLPELHLGACSQAEQLAMDPNYAEKAKKIEFILGSFLEVNLNEATLVFINSTTLLGTVWESLCARINDLPQLNTVITTSKTLISNNFLVTNHTKIEMSWGVVEAYIHRRKTNLY
ncbi:hypothetical protein MJ258_02735 [Legionella sp. EUR-108]|uniref:Histone-lysine N-methyltransferase, H3 lysine-79 specific n=2 Tax=Legionella maioricensis TaxID=2896528 RepID=A0A9X2CYH9_9GAMM|nr:hypothetical protein [Legionella maioricensis]MCL9686420.1 hypothetical protein [Legionella maioricensis]